MNELETKATEKRQRIVRSIEAARQRARAEREIGELMKRNPGGTDRLVGDLKRRTVAESEEVRK